MFIESVGVEGVQRPRFALLQEEKQPFNAP